MSLPHFSKITRLFLFAALAGTGFAGTAYAADAASSRPSVQTYADQALPVAPPSAHSYYESPLAAGSLTLHDVLEAHRPLPEQAPKLPAIGTAPNANAVAPLLNKSGQTSSTGMMLSDGMKEVLQKVNTTAAPVLPATSSATQAAQPLLMAPTLPGAKTAATAYQPGQQPKNLGSAGGDIAVSAVDRGASAAATVACDAQHVQKWEKSCGEAGYPATYVGKIVGETRVGCADNTLHDVWVTNTCAPPDAASGQTAKTDGVCGAASNNEFDESPTASLCGQGIPSPVSGDGPWTWACSGVNGGDAAACIARRHVAPTHGACGPANGVAVAAAPVSELCNGGKASSISGSGPWTWSCEGSDKGRSESCIAPVAAHTSVVEPVAVPAPVSAPAPVVSAPIAAAPVVAPAPVAAPKAAVTKAPAAPSETQNDPNSLCGSAAEILAYQAPEKDLCRTGSPSVVNGDGPWTWACTTNEGVTSSCRTLSLSDGSGSSAPVAAAPAPASALEPAAKPSESILAVRPKTPASILAASAAPTPVTDDLACGAAAGQPSPLAPASDLCKGGGKASKVSGPNPWRWTCSKAKRKISCETPKTVDGSCGPANGAALKSAPFSGLCAAGSPSSVSGEGPWHWTCNGSNSGIEVSCAASLETKMEKERIDGACGTANGGNYKDAPPVDSLCGNGIASAVSGEGPWTWSCSGANGGNVGSCSAAKIQPPKAPGPLVNGVCGGANGVISARQPEEALCSSGKLSGVVGNGPWNWSCIGENGGMTVSCTAPLEPPAAIEGSCGGASGVSTLVKPQSGLCSSGITGTVNGEGPWTWTCSGANGGNPASCIAPLAGKSAATPSIMTLPADGEVTAPVAPLPIPPSRLVTPQLASPQPPEPALDKKTLPRLTSSKPFPTMPSPSKIPPSVEVADLPPPAIVPSLPPQTTSLTPPSFSSNLPSAPAFQAAAPSAHVPGNKMVLDKSLATFAFKHGSGNIDASIVPTLDRLAAVLRDNPDARIALYGYADNAGSTPRDARRLSLTRGIAVRTYLASKGIPESRVDIHAEGANTTDMPIDRVDVKVNG